MGKDGKNGDYCNDMDQIWCIAGNSKRKSIAAIAVIAVVLVSVCIPMYYSMWYNDTTMDVVDEGNAVKMESDWWGRWVTLDTGGRWHVENDAWTTIRIGDTVTVYATWPAWEVLVDHRISIA